MITELLSSWLVIIIVKRITIKESAQRLRKLEFRSDDYRATVVLVSNYNSKTNYYKRVGAAT